MNYKQLQNVFSLKDLRRPKVCRHIFPDRYSPNLKINLGELKQLIEYVYHSTNFLN
jgi:hypothetical protein